MVVGKKQRTTVNHIYQDILESSTYKNVRGHLQSNTKELSPLSKFIFHLKQELEWVCTSHLVLNLSQVTKQCVSHLVLF